MYRFRLADPFEALFDEETRFYLHYYNPEDSVDYISQAIKTALDSGKIFDVLGNAGNPEVASVMMVTPSEGDPEVTGESETASEIDQLLDGGETTEVKKTRTKKAEPEA